MQYVRNCRGFVCVYVCMHLSFSFIIQHFCLISPLPPLVIRHKLCLYLLIEDQRKGEKGDMGKSVYSSQMYYILEAKSCEDIQCTGGKKCLWDFKVGRGRCSLCDELCPDSKSDEPVCASDNATYASECAMKEAACSSGVLLEVKHSGSCNCKCDF